MQNTSISKLTNVSQMVIEKYFRPDAPTEVAVKEILKSNRKVINQDSYLGKQTYFSPFTPIITGITDEVKTILNVSA